MATTIVFGPMRFLQRSLPAMAITVCVAMSAAPTWAGFVTTNEADLDEIFSQAAFDSTPIDIRFNPTITVDRGDLLTIDSKTQLGALFDLGGSNAPTVDLFYVDAIGECGGDLSPLTNTRVTGSPAGPPSRYPRRGCRRMPPGCT